jgi:hypothetical protein
LRLLPPGDELCPWGLSEDKLYAFKVSGTITPGNFGAIAACGNGATNYRNCINGEQHSGFYEEGEEVHVGPQTGNLGQNTHAGLAERYADEAASGYPCDIAATPDPVTGMDPDGREEAYERYVNSTGCEHRLVLIAVIEEFPTGHSDSIHVLGVSTFAIVRWDRQAPWGNAEGTTEDACGEAAGGSGFQCGMVWGFLMKDAFPPEFLLDQIGDTDNPFAPLLVALTE